MRAVGSQATPEVKETWEEVYRLFRQFEGERRERLQQVADRLGVSFKVARRRLRNYEAMEKLNPNPHPVGATPEPLERGRTDRRREEEAGTKRAELIEVKPGGVRLIKKGGK